MNVWPTNLQRAEADGLLIQWSDGQSRRYTARDLRRRCPCATCREQRNQTRPGPLLPIITEAEAQPLRILGMKPVGNYAYSIQFSDGHDTGIFSLELLHTCGEPVLGQP